MGITETYFIKNGNVNLPFIETIHRNESGDVVGSSNLRSPSDVQITEIQYDQYVADVQEAIALRVSEVNVDIQIIKDSAKAKLIALGLTEEEITVIIT